MESAVLLEVSRQGSFRDVAESSNFLMCQSLTLEIQNFHFLLNSRMRVAIPLIVQFGNLFLSKFNPNHADNSPDRLEVDYLIIPFLKENIIKV